MKFFRCVTMSQSRHERFKRLNVRWLSWGENAIHFFQTCGKDVDQLAAPSKISVRGCSPYECSYSYRLSRIDRSLRERVLSLSESLLSFPLGSTLNLLTGMLDPPSSSSRLAKLFALLRAGVVRLTGDPKSALNAPVFATRRDDGFPLHADLFLTERLFLIFDDVPQGPLGASLFLPVKTLLDVASQLHGMPPQVAGRLRHLVKNSAARDSFDEFYDLLYSEDHAWRDEMAGAIKLVRSQIKLNRGEGYLINDRHWLHGRNPLHGAVSRSRFRRLVFGLRSLS